MQHIPSPRLVRQQIKAAALLCLLVGLVLQFALAGPLSFLLYVAAFILVALI